MSYISYIPENEVSKYVGLEDVSELTSVEDVATLIETFEDVKRKVSFDRIKTVVQDDEKYYYFVISEEKTDFDLFEFINAKLVIGVKVSGINVKTLFPEKASRGIYNDGDESEEVYTSDQEDTPTGYLGEDSLPKVDKGILYLRHVKEGLNIDIPVRGLVMGRLSKKVDYIIKGNDSVGRVHCKVYFDGNRLMVHDYNSTNGTFVNNRKVHTDKDVELVFGDVLLLADEEFKVVS